MNRIEKTFIDLKEKNRKAFVPYLMAGDGGLGSLNERLLILENLGAAAIEVGIPFSDPVADGPVIQQAGIRSLKNGTSLRTVIDEIKKARTKISVPLLLMTYLNPVFSYGIEQFVNDIQEAGIDGCIIPDLPIEEEDLIVPFLNEVNIELIRLVTMSTPLERISMISKLGKGFLYTVTVKGITGERKEYGSELISFLKTVNEISSIPVLAGFGISNEEQIKELSSYCDGVVVGSKIVELFEKNDLEAMKRLISVLQEDLSIS